VRRAIRFTLALVLLAAAGGAGRSASADSVEGQLARARSNQKAAQQALDHIERRVAALTAEYGRARRHLEDAARNVLAAYQERIAVSARLAEAREILDRQAARAYEAGPALSIELFLGSTSSSDFASAQEFAARAISVNGEIVSRVEALNRDARLTAGAFERKQAEVASTFRKLQSLATQAAQQVADAKALAHAAGLTVAKLDKQERALEAAQSNSRSDLSGLIDAERGVDQSRLLAMLGPNGGRGCEIPTGLRETSQGLAGISSWYGWGFAGRPTASGAIYDPRLFTAANKELPLDTFIRVHYGAKCAIVLVNDRGPYIAGRVLDLSQAAAEYLGVGLNYVTADVLAPA